MYQRVLTFLIPSQRAPRMMPSDQRMIGVGEEEEQAGDDHHGEHEARGDQRLAPRRPGDLRRLGAHLLQELEGVALRHRLLTSGSAPSRRPSAAASIRRVLKDSRRGAQGAARRHDERLTTAGRVSQAPFEPGKRRTVRLQSLPRRHQQEGRPLALPGPFRLRHNLFLARPPFVDMRSTNPAGSSRSI